MPLPLMLESTAVFSSDEVYRYSLARMWNRELPRVCFVMLNPSAADETQNDPTIRRCIRFAESWGKGSIVVVNLFAYRTHDPGILKAAADPVGAENDAHVAEAIQSCNLTILAWGVHGHSSEHSRRMISRLPNAYCLGVTKLGAPKHPLYVAGCTRPTAYSR